ncbi:MAG: hypothetical protein WDW38_003292 [Sanguina aurantia]
MLAAKTWPALLGVFILYVDGEMDGAGGKGKPLDPVMSRTLRRVVQAAELESRSGRKAQLARRSSKLFTHVSSVLRRHNMLTTAIGTDYNLILRQHLLAPGSDYPATSHSAVFQELLTSYMDRMRDIWTQNFESLPLGGPGVDSNGVMSTISSLIVAFPGEMSEDFRDKLLRFFQELLLYLHSVRDTRIVAVTALSALTSFLLTNGLDVSSKAAPLHAAIWPYLKRAWREARQPKLKAVRDVTVSADSAASGSSAAADDCERPSKRARSAPAAARTPALQRLAEAVESNPSLWVPTLVLLLRLYPHTPAQQFLLLSKLLPATVHHLAQRLANLSREPDGARPGLFHRLNASSAVTVWMLRAVAELARSSRHLVPTESIAAAFQEVLQLSLQVIAHGLKVQARYRQAAEDNAPSDSDGTQAVAVAVAAPSDVMLAAAFSAAAAIVSVFPGMAAATLRPDAWMALLTEAAGCEKSEELAAAVAAAGEIALHTQPEPRNDSSQYESHVPDPRAQCVGSGTAAMAVAEDDVIHTLLPRSLPAWFGIGVAGTAWLTRSLALTHGAEYFERRLWLQQHNGSSSGAGARMQGGCGSNGGRGRGGDGGINGDSGGVAVQMHHTAVVWLEERILQGLQECITAEADVNEPQLLRIMVLMSTAAALLGSDYCRSVLAPATPPQAAAAPAAETGAGAASAADSRSAVTRLASSVGRAVMTLLQMVVEDALGPAGVQQHLLSAPCQVPEAVPLLLLLLKQLSEERPASDPAAANLDMDLDVGPPTQRKPARPTQAGAPQLRHTQAGATQMALTQAGTGHTGPGTPGPSAAVGEAPGAGQMPAAALLLPGLIAGRATADALLTPVQLCLRLLQALGECCGSSVASASLELWRDLNSQDALPSPEILEGLAAALCTAVASGTSGYSRPPRGIDTQRRNGGSHGLETAARAVRRADAESKLFEAALQHAANTAAAAAAALKRTSLPSSACRPLSSSSPCSHLRHLRLLTATPSTTHGADQNMPQQSELWVDHRDSTRGRGADSSQMLGAESGLLSGPPQPGVRLAFVLVLLRCLTAWLLQRELQSQPGLVMGQRAAAAESQGGGEEERFAPLSGTGSQMSARACLLVVVESVTNQMLDLEGRSASTEIDSVPWQVRALLHSLTADLIPNSPADFPSSALITSLMEDLKFATARTQRVIAARLPELLLTWQAHAQIIAAVMDHVQLAEPAPKPGRKATPPASAETCEACVTAVAGMAAVADLRSEALCLRTLLGHAAMCRRDLSVVTAALQALACSMGYASLSQYLDYHFPVLIWQWFEEGRTLDQILSLHSLWAAPSTPLQPRSRVSSPDQQRQQQQQQQQLPVAVGSSKRGVPLPATAAQLQQGTGPAASLTHAPAVSAVLALFGSQFDGQQSAYGNPAVSDGGGCSSSTGGAADSGDGHQQQRQRQQQRGGIPGGGRAGFLASHAGALLVPLDMLDSQILRAELPDMEDVLGDCMTQTMAHILSLATPGEVQDLQATAPFFSPKELEGCIAMLPGQAGGREENADLLWNSLLTGRSVARILLQLHAHLKGAVHHRHREQRLACMEALLLLLGHRVAEPASCSYILHILLEQLLVPELHAVTCSLINNLLTHLLQPGQLPTPPDQAERCVTFGLILPTLVSAVTEALLVSECHPPAPDPPTSGSLPLVHLLLDVSTGLPEHMHTYLVACDPIPELPELAAARQLQLGLKAVQHPSSELRRFTVGVRQMSSYSRHRALSAVRQAVHDRWGELLQPAGPTTVPGQLRPDVVACAWGLAEAAASLGDAQLGEFAGQLLSAAGTLDPTSIAPQVPTLDAAIFTSVPATAPAAAAAAAAAAASQPSTTSRRKSNPQVQAPAPVSPTSCTGSCIVPVSTICAVLQLLHSYCLDPDLRVIHVCQLSATALLARPEGRAALDFLASQPSEPTGHASAAAAARHLAVFSITDDGGEATGSGPGSGVEPAELPSNVQALTAQLRIGDADVWTVPVPASRQGSGHGPSKTGGAAGAAAYESWLCELVSTLLAVASDPVLRMLRSLARLKPVLCTLLLPSLLQDLLTAPTQPPAFLASVLSRQIGAHIIGLPGCDPRCVAEVCRGGVSRRCVRRCVAEVCRGGVSRRCVAEVCRGGVSRRCVAEVCRGGVSRRCVAEVCRGGVSRRCVAEVCREATNASPPLQEHAGAHGSVRCPVYGVRMHAARVPPILDPLGSTLWGIRHEEDIRTARPLAPFLRNPIHVAAGLCPSQLQFSLCGLSSAVQLFLTGLEHLRSLHTDALVGYMPAPQRKGRDSAVPGVGALLTELYTSINEPDSLYALSGRPGATAQLRLTEHEHNWPATLQGYDLALQHSTPAQFSNPSPAQVSQLGDVEGQLQPPQCVFGIVSALQELGCSHTALQYVRGCSVGGSCSSALGTGSSGPGSGSSGGSSSGAATAAAAALKIRELQSELAWRLGQWEDSSSAVAGLQAFGNHNRQQQQQQQQQQQLGSSLPSSMEPEATRPPGGGGRAAVADITASLGAGLGGSGGGGGGGGGAGDGVSGGFHGAVHAVLRALRSGDAGVVEALLQGATMGVVHALTSGGSESVGSINRGLLHLQMISMVRTAAAAAATSLSPTAPPPSILLLLPSIEPAKSGAFPPGGGGSSSAGSSRESYSLCEPLLALRCSLLDVLRRPEARAVALIETVVLCRKAGRVAQGLAALQELTALLAQHSNRHATRDAAATAAADSGDNNTGGSSSSSWADSLLRLDAPWRLEGARLSWKRGQQQLAISTTATLLAELGAAAGGLEGAADGAGEARAVAGGSSSGGRRRVGGSGGPVNRLQLALALSLAGKWAAAASLESSSTEEVMALMSRAADLVFEEQRSRADPTSSSVRVKQSRTPHPAARALSPAAGSAAECAPVASKVLYRLASYADSRYTQAVNQQRSPEYLTQQRVLNSKMSQVADLEKHLQNTGPSGPLAQSLATEIRKLARTIDADEAVRASLVQHECQCLSVALANYQRCLMEGDKYDLRVVFRLCQLWFALTGSAAQQSQAAFQAIFSQASEQKTNTSQVPSFKFVPLVYQIASRLGGTDTGFQEVLQSALLRLAREHPFHTLYQLFALTHPGPSKAPAKGDAHPGVLAHSVDKTRVEAAAHLLECYGKSGTKQAKIKEQMSILVEGYIELAATPVPDKASIMTFPAPIRRRLKDLDHIPITSVPLEPDPTTQYNNLPMVRSFREKISFVGGINLPKLVKCEDSFGGNPPSAREERQ